MAKNVTNTKRQIAYQKGLTPQHVNDLPTHVDQELKKIQSSIDQINGSVNPSDNTVGFKNRIFNGNIVIDQLGIFSSAVDPNTISTSLPYLDMIYGNASQSGKMTLQVSSSNPVSGFPKYLAFTSTSNYTPISTDAFDVQFPIEGMNIADLAWGTANAQAVTISFWVKSNNPGTWTGSIRNLPVAYSYPFTYTINTSGVWEYKSVTIPGPTVGTWTTDNSVGAIVTLDYGTGSTYLSSSNATWVSGNYHGTQGSKNIVSTSGNYLHATGLQLERGNTATNFDLRPISQEMKLCQRYLRKMTTGYVAVTNPGIFYDANNLRLLLNTDISTFRKYPSVIYTKGTQGTDWAIMNSSNVLQTGFTLTMVNGYVNAAKTTHGLTAGSLWVATSNGAVYLIDNIYS